MGFKTRMFGIAFLAYAAIAFCANILSFFPGIPGAHEIFNPLDAYIAPYFPFGWSFILGPMLPFIWSGFWAVIGLLALIFG